MNLLQEKEYRVPSWNFMKKNVLCKKGDEITWFDGIVLSYMHDCAANEGLVRIQYKCLVTIYVFPEMKLVTVFPKQNLNVLSPNFLILVSVIDLYIPRIWLPILLHRNRQIDPRNILLAQRYMNVGIRNKGTRFISGNK